MSRGFRIVGYCNNCENLVLSTFEISLNRKATFVHSVYGETYAGDRLGIFYILIVRFHLSSGSAFSGQNAVLNLAVKFCKFEIRSRTKPICSWPLQERQDDKF